jgi:serine/threonine-protein kinase
MTEPARTPARVGRYLLYDEIARGGMAAVHVGRLEGPAGFKRTVAVKRLHGTLGSDPEFVSLFLDEARIAARIEHPNVVPVLDVVSVDREVLLVMEYVHGESLAELLYESQTRKVRPPLRIVAQIMVNALTGLHAAHETRGEDDVPLQIIHRDVSPHNIMVSADGIARLVDFGIARAERRITATTKEGNIRGKLAYMAPEQLDESGNVDRRADVYAAALVFWEAVVGRRLFDQDASVIIAKKLSDEGDRPSKYVTDVPPAIEAIIMRGMARSAGHRYATALEMARAIEAAVPPVSPREIAEWVAELAGPRLLKRAALVASSSNAGSVGALSTPGPVRAPSAAYVSSRDITLPKQRVLSKPALFALGALLAIASVGTCAAIRRPSTSPSSVAVAAPPPSAPLAPVTAAIPPPDVAVTPPLSAEAPATLAAPTADVGAASAPASSGAKKRTKVGLAAGGTPAPAKTNAKRPECDPPWRVDDHGVRILKKECF